MNNEKKKTFDRGECFTFFGKWYEMIKNLEETFGTNEQAYRLFTAIAEYSLYQIQPEFTDEFKFLQAMWPVFEEQIDSSIANRSKHFESENRKEKASFVLVYSDVCLSCLSFAAQSAVKIKGIS